MPTPNGRNAKLIKIHNRALALRIIQQQGSISRKAIAAITGLTQAAITKITRDLLAQGLILEQVPESEQEPLETKAPYGRKPISLAINQEKHKIISVYLGRQVLKSAIFDLAGNLLEKQEYDQNILTKDNAVIVREMIACIQALLQRDRLDLRNVLGIGIAAPGPINAQQGILRGMSEQRARQVQQQSAVPFDWSNLPLKEAIQRELGVRVFADNDANVSALAESWFGNGMGISNFVLYSIGTGIGAGVIIDGMLYRGEDDVVAEIGHTTIDFNGPPCVCGNVGCLELYANFARIVAEYRELAESGSEGGKASAICTSEQLFAAAEHGDAVARQLLQKKAKFLGIGAVSLANIFSPEYIIVAPNDLGNVDLSMIAAELQRCIKNRAFSVIADKVKVIPAKLKHDIQLYGGVALVLQDFFQMSPTPAEKFEEC